MTLAEELGMRPLLAHCHVGLGKLYWRSAATDTSEEHLTTAMAMMREMEMGLWLERGGSGVEGVGRDALRAVPARESGRRRSSAKNAARPLTRSCANCGTQLSTSREVLPASARIR